MTLAIDRLADQVSELIQQITRELNPLNLPFTLSCFHDPLAYPHPEAAILTLNVAHQG